MSDNTDSRLERAVQPTDLRAIDARIVGEKMRKSLDVVMGWQSVELSTRWVLGCGDLKRLTIQIREQPVNFMSILRQSLTAAEMGQSLCKQGSKASKILLGEDQHDEHIREGFTIKSLEDIKKSASDLKVDTKSICEEFRSLRTGVFGIHEALRKITRGQAQSSLLTRISRQLNKNVRICETKLQRVLEDLREIENSLNLATRWWQQVDADANYLRMNSASSLMADKNQITLKDIKEGFMTLEGYFSTYFQEMSALYDENFAKLNADAKKALINSHCDDQDRQLAVVRPVRGNTYPPAEPVRTSREAAPRPLSWSL